MSRIAYVGELTVDDRNISYRKSWAEYVVLAIFLLIGAVMIYALIALPA